MNDGYMFGLASHLLLTVDYDFERLWDKRTVSRMMDHADRDELLDVATLTKGLGASEARDQVYAMLWLVPKDMDTAVAVHNVDYGKTLETIYTEYTTAIMGMGCQIFHMINGDSRNPLLPSWVPDCKLSSASLSGIC